MENIKNIEDQDLEHIFKNIFIWVILKTNFYMYAFTNIFFLLKKCRSSQKLICFIYFFRKQDRKESPYTSFTNLIHKLW